MIKKIKIIKSVLLIAFIVSKMAVFAQEKPAYDFKLKNSKDKIVNLSDFKGKVVVMDFWFTGCINCMNFYKTSLSEAEQHYKNNPDVVFITICIDKEKNKWLASLEKERYTSKTSQNLYTEGFGDKHPVIKQYNITAYPQPLVIGKRGELLSRSEDLLNRKVLEKSIEDALIKNN
jgi:peroxiredoxin